MIPSAVVDEMIEDAVDKALDTERHKLAREMLANGISMEKVSLITGFSKEEILSRKE
jgi:transcriptional regulator GlxA family with amidase domain